MKKKIELKIIGIRITSIKDSLGWDTADLAKTAGIERSNCKKIEKGETNTFMTILYAIIQALGLFPSDFFNEEYQAI